MSYNLGRREVGHGPRARLASCALTLLVTLGCGSSGSKPELTPEQLLEQQWNVASFKNTITGFQEFLKLHPGSAHEAEAQARISAIEEGEQKVMSLRIGMTFPEVEAIIGASEENRKAYDDWLEVKGDIGNSSTSRTSFDLLFLHDWKYVIYIKDGVLAGVGTGTLENPSWIKLGQE